MSDREVSIEEQRTATMREAIEVESIFGDPYRQHVPSTRLYKTTFTRVPPDGAYEDDEGYTEVRCDIVFFDSELIENTVPYPTGFRCAGIVVTFVGDDTSDWNWEGELQDYEMNVDVLTETFAPELAARIVELLEEEGRRFTWGRLQECLDKQGMMVSQVADPHIREFLKPLLKMSVEDLRKETVREHFDTTLRWKIYWKNARDNDSHESVPSSFQLWRIYKTTSSLVASDDVDQNEVKTEVRCDVVQARGGDEVFRFGFVHLGVVGTFCGHDISEATWDSEPRDLEEIDAFTGTFAPELSESIIELLKDIETGYLRGRLRKCLEERSLTVSQVSDPQIRQFLQSLEAELMTGEDAHPEALTE